MRRFVFAKLAAAFVLGTLAASALEAQAQIKFGPQGQIGIPNLFGTHTWIHPDRLNPLANIPVTPLQSPPGVLGQTWLGADGKLHGNVIDPNTGDFHAFNHNGAAPGGNGFLVEPDPGPHPPHHAHGGFGPPPPQARAIGQPWQSGPPQARPLPRPRPRFPQQFRRW